MAYEKQTFIDKQTVLMAAHLQHIEDGIERAFENVGPGGETIATRESLGSVMVGENLKISDNGVLSVDTTNEMAVDNTKPITSAGVAVQVGNIHVLLQTI